MSGKLNGQSIILMFCFLFLLNTLAAAQETPFKTTTDNNSLLRAARIFNKNGGAISSKELVDSTNLILIHPYDTLFQIVSFRLTRVRKGKVPIEIKNERGSKLTDEMNILINSTIKGDKLYFEYIKCKNLDGSMLTIDALSFVIE